MGQMIRELYDPESDVHDALACDFITEMLDIPGVKEAVLMAALHDEEKNGYGSLIRPNSLEAVGDIPFQFAWDTIMNQVKEET